MTECDVSDLEYGHLLASALPSTENLHRYNVHVHNIITCINYYECYNHKHCIYTRLKWVSIHGTKYHEGSIITLASNVHPLFGHIIDILVINVDTVYFVCEMLETVVLYSPTCFCRLNTTQTNTTCSVTAKWPSWFSCDWTL